jgi:hypothetical protein
MTFQTTKAVDMVVDNPRWVADMMHRVTLVEGDTSRHKSTMSLRAILATLALHQ